MEQHEHDEESRLQHEARRRRFDAMLVAQVALAARLKQLIAEMDARERLGRGEDGFDG